AGRLPAGAAVGARRVPPWPVVEARRLRRPPRAHAGGPQRGRGNRSGLPDLRGRPPGPRVVRLRPPAATRRPVHLLGTRAGPVVRACRSAHLLRRRGLPRVLVEPPGAGTAAGQREPSRLAGLLVRRLVGVLRAAREAPQLGVRLRARRTGRVPRLGCDVDPAHQHELVVLAGAVLAHDLHWWSTLARGYDLATAGSLSALDGKEAHRHGPDSHRSRRARPQARR